MMQEELNGVKEGIEDRESQNESIKRSGKLSIS
jgi:hypothetical protein